LEAEKRAADRMIERLSRTGNGVACDALLDAAGHENLGPDRGQGTIERAYSRAGSCAT
jgi:hypothetical protein